MTTKKRSKLKSMWVGYDNNNEIVWGPGTTKRQAEQWLKRIRAIYDAPYYCSIEKYVREAKKKK